jgi:phosphotransacetylase
VKLTGDKNILKRLRPTQCFVGTASSELYSKLFAFVDFGTRANAFLGACGIRQEPTAEDIAQILVTEPRRVYELANVREK